MLQNKNITKLLSLILAISLWFYVVAVENPPTKVKVSSVPIKLLNQESLNQRGLAINTDEDYFLDVVIQGARSDVLEVSADDITATADLFGYNLGENYIPVTVTVPDKVTLADQKTNLITVKIERMVSVYKPLEVQFSGKARDKYEATVVSKTPEEVEVRGARAQVAKVDKVVATVEVDRLSQYAQIFTEDLSAIDARGNAVKNVSLSANSATIEAASYAVKEVELEAETTGEVAKQYQIMNINIPEKIKIKGTKKALAKVNKVTAEVTDLSGITATSDIPLKLKLPDKVMVADESKDASISVTIKGISQKSFDVDAQDIEITGAPEGSSAAINSQSVSLKVAGKESVIQDITASDLKLKVDVTGLEPGMHLVKVSCELPEGVSDVTIDPAEVHITVVAGS